MFNLNNRDPALWKELKLSSNRRSKDHCEAITTLISRCSLLRTVSVTRRTDVKDLIPSLAASCPDLKHLEIKYCSSLKLSGIMKLLKLGMYPQNSLILILTDFFRATCHLTQSELDDMMFGLHALKARHWNDRRPSRLAV